MVTENIIQFEDKETLTEHSEIPEINKVTANNMNEIKKVVNNHANSLNDINERMNQKNSNYSSEEIDTGNVWIDGKKIYRKTFHVTNAIKGENKIDISNLNYDTIISINGMEKNSSNQWIPLSFYNGASTYNYMFVWNKDKNIYYQVAWAATDVYITLEYTKGE